MDNSKNVIGISAGLCTPEFLEMLTCAIRSCKTINGDQPTIQSIRLDWDKPAANAPTLVQEGDKKCRVYDEVKYLAKQGAKVVAVPNFGVLTFIDELQTECTVPIANIGTAIAKSFGDKQGTKIGYLGEPDTPKYEAFKECFAGNAEVEWITPDPQEVELINKFMSLVHGSKCVDNENQTALEYLVEACKNLVDKGAQIILPTCIRQTAFAGELASRGYKLVDVAQCYANYLCETDWKPLPKPFKLGMVGGLGPMATVDLYGKITRATPAGKDQEHIKIVIEQNPQVPDRTQYLLYGGVDPTLALYAACEKLQADDVDIIVFPCNTAHAYIDTLIPHLKVPILDMQRVSAEEIKRKFGGEAVVGIMATDGTCLSGLYDAQIEKLGLKYVKPDPKYQKLVMESIYGEKGVKAGFNDGLCRDQLLEAAEHLVKDKGATVLILGCTELPLLLAESDAFEIAGKKVGIVDPTAAVARSVVAIAEEITKKRGRR